MCFAQRLAWQPPSAGSRPVPIGPRSIGVSLQPAKSSAGCSPAEPASASPVTDDNSSIPIRRGNQSRCSFSLQACSSGPRPASGCRAVSRSSGPPPTGVSSLLCAPRVISILRRQVVQAWGRILDRSDTFGGNASPFPIPSMVDLRHVRLIATGESFAVVVRADRSS